MGERYDPQTGIVHIDGPAFAGWTQEQIDLLLTRTGLGYLGVADNKYGVPTAVFRCSICGQPYTVTPVFPGAEREVTCGDPESCSSYDPARDVAALLRSGATLHAEAGGAPPGS